MVSGYNEKNYSYYFDNLSLFYLVGLKKSSLSSKSPKKGVCFAPPPQNPQDITLPFVISEFIDEKHQRRLCLKIHLLSGATSATVKARVEACGRKLSVLCRYKSNFLDPERHRECFQANDRTHLFSSTDVRMVSFSHAASMLEKNSDKTVWGKMSIHLPFEVETSFYNEDVIPGYDLFRCDAGFFLHVQCVENHRVKKKEKRVLPGVRIIPQRNAASNYQTPTNNRRMNQQGGSVFFSNINNNNTNTNQQTHQPKNQPTNPQNNRDPNPNPNPPDPPLPPPPPQEDPMAVPTNRALFGVKRPRVSEEQEVHMPMQVDGIGALISEYAPNPNPNPSNFSQTYQLFETSSPYDFAKDCPTAAQNMNDFEENMSFGKLSNLSSDIEEMFVDDF